MGEIFLSQIVGDHDVANSLEAVERTSDPENYTQKTPAKTRVAIAESCKGYTLPANINKFITDIYPNMKAFIFAKTRDEDETAEIINNFVLYMLSPAPTRDNLPHWKLYDPIKYSKQPYYKYFLVNLRFFQQNRQREMYKQAQMYTLSETDFDSTADNPANNAINLDTLATHMTSDSSYELVFMGQIEKYLTNMSEHHAESMCFEAKAEWLYRARSNGLANSEIADHLQISPSAVSQWMTKLKGIVTTFLEGEVPEDYSLYVKK